MQRSRWGVATVDPRNEDRWRYWASNLWRMEHRLPSTRHDVQPSAEVSILSDSSRAACASSGKVSGDAIELP